MNYANMIEEKNLKKTFIVATLCSTLIGTFSASMGLYDRVSEKRKRHRQNQRDSKQDEEIKKLRKEIEDAEQRGKDRAPKDREWERDDVGDNLGMSGAMIQRQFDEGYGRLGRRFAVGDAQTENALQAQIIALQQTVIHVLQDALENSRPLTRADQAKLIAASNAAREGSIEALRQQQLRLDAPDSPQRALVPPKRASTIIDIDLLFCRYSLDLQYIPNKALASTFAPGQNGQCPDCGLRLDVASDDFWAIGKCKEAVVVENGYEKEVTETREFHLGQRFVVKCHTADGDYACVLCSRHRDHDAICRSVDALVNHVGRFHGVEELEQEIDLKERAPAKSRLALGPPPVLSPPPAREVVEVGRAYR